MQDNEIINNWDFNHFMIYLYLCIADSDYNITDDEIEEIEKKLQNNLLKDGEDSKKMIAEVLKEFKQHTDYEKTAFINENVKAYCTEESVKRKIITGLEDIMAADGVIKSVEIIMYRYIKKTIENI